MTIVCGLVLLPALLAGCGKETASPFVANHRPTVELVVAPTPGDSTGYAVELRWIGHDTDGYVSSYEYALDPPASAGPGSDTAWVETADTHVLLRVSASRGPDLVQPPGIPIFASDYHTVVVRAVDHQGVRSAPLARSFTAWTVAPVTRILDPDGTSQLSIGTTPSFRVTWRGEDPDGDRAPVSYRVRLARASDIDPLDPGSISPGKVQAFFGADAPRFEAAGWDSLPGDSTGRMLENLEPATRYFLAVVAVDESGAYEPRFDLDQNVLDFTPTLDRISPGLRVWNEFFSRAQLVGGISLDEGRIFKIEFPAATPLAFHWEGFPTQAGMRVDAYRWAFDIADVFDETPRSGPGDVAHWSPWSPATTWAEVGPLAAAPDSVAAPRHHFRVEVRDTYGRITLFTLRITVIAPSLESDLLLVDDLYGRPTPSDPTVPGGILLSGAYPLEAEQDSFHVARGGFPDSLFLRSGTPGVLSARGVFADFATDTLDYRFEPTDGIPLSRLLRYRAVAWYTDHSSAVRNGSKFGSVSPMTALRSIHSVNRMNTLAAYVRQGGHVWLFGEGATTAIANGWYSRYGTVPRAPFTSGRDPRENVLSEGNFLHDFIRLRSELSLGGGTPSSRLVGAIPFLPAEWPNEPGAERTAERWFDLPRLSQGSYRTSDSAPFGLVATWWISRPNHAWDGPPSYAPAMDTLYTYKASVPEPGGPDGFPSAVHVHVSDGTGQVVWFGFPLHYFEREQVRDVVRAVMRNFGIAPDPSVRHASGGRVTRRSDPTTSGAP